MNSTTELTGRKALPFSPAATVKSEVATVAAFVGAATVPVAIGLFHLLSEVSPGVKTFLTLHSGIGPYSGKVFYGYLAGSLLAVLGGLIGRRVSASVWVWLGVFLAGLVLGTALVFTPVVHALVHLLG